MISVSNNNSSEFWSSEEGQYYFSYIKNMAIHEIEEFYQCYGSCEMAASEVMEIPLERIREDEVQEFRRMLLEFRG